VSKVVCLGYFERGNSGDEAFKSAHEWFFGKENIEFANGKLTEDFVAGRPLFLGGGDVVAPFFLDWIPNSVPFSMLGVGLKYEASSLRAMGDKGPALRHSWFRNHIDVEMAQAAGFSAEYCPDIVFSLRDAVEPLPKSVQSILTKIGEGNEFAVVCLTDHFNSRFELKDIKHNAYLEYFKWELAEALDKLAEKMPIVFLPLSVYLQHQDARMHADVVSRMKRAKRTHQITEELTPVQAISLVRQASHMVSMKLHGNIYGLLTKRRCVNIGVGRKQLTLYAESGLGDCSVHPGELSVRSFESAFEASNTPAARKKVADMSDANYAALCNLRTTLRKEVGLPI
jgi:polysaccharide pyruvyl transferase WcaK-like protein